MLYVNPQVQISYDGKWRASGSGIISTELTASMLHILLTVSGETYNQEDLLTIYRSGDIGDDTYLLLDANILIPKAEIVNRTIPRDLRSEVFTQFRHDFHRIREYTMLSPASCFALREAIRYITRNKIMGDIAMTGIWRGGAASLCAQELSRCGEETRHLYLFDTFEWKWPIPTLVDSTIYGRSNEATHSFVHRQIELSHKQDAVSNAGVSREHVIKLLHSTKYPQSLFHLVEGYVENTLPESIPKDTSLALVHLDTDFYQSTLHELKSLYPQIVKGGVLIIDDVPTERGADQAVEEYFNGIKFKPFMSRLDYQGRLIIKP